MNTLALVAPPHGRTNSCVARLKAARSAAVLAASFACLGFDCCSIDPLCRRRPGRDKKTAMAESGGSPSPVVPGDQPHTVDAAPKSPPPADNNGQEPAAEGPRLRLGDIDSLLGEGSFKARGLFFVVARRSLTVAPRA